MTTFRKSGALICFFLAAGPLGGCGKKGHSKVPVVQGAPTIPAVTRAGTAPVLSALDSANAIRRVPITGAQTHLSALEHSQGGAAGKLNPLSSEFSSAATVGTPSLRASSEDSKSPGSRPDLSLPSAAGLLRASGSGSGPGGPGAGGAGSGAQGLGSSGAAANKPAEAGAAAPAAAGGSAPGAGSGAGGAVASNTRSGGFGGAGGLGFGKGVGDLFGGGSGTEGAGAARTDSFGARSGEVNPLGSEDPNDYFTRLGIADDIFKIVERRYRNKAVTWVRSQAEGVSARSRMP